MGPTVVCTGVPDLPRHTLMSKIWYSVLHFLFMYFSSFVVNLNIPYLIFLAERIKHFEHCTFTYLLRDSAVCFGHHQVELQ